MERKNVKTGFLFFSTGADGHDGHLTINQAKPMHVAVRSGAIEWSDRCDGPFSRETMHACDERGTVITKCMIAPSVHQAHNAWITVLKVPTVGETFPRTNELVAVL
jgi:hypothetical protein